MIALTQLGVTHFNQDMKAGHAVTKNEVPQLYKLQYLKVLKTYVVKTQKWTSKKCQQNKFLS